MALPRQYKRHNEILERLQNGETLSITQLAREWDTTTKTVQRDFNKLMEGNYGVIRADDGKQFVLSKKQVTSKSADTAVKMLDSLLSDMGGKLYSKVQPVLHKIQRHIESPFYTRIDVEDISDTMDLIEDLEYAISKQKMITFEYKRWWKPNEIKTHEEVKPYKIVIFNGFWYLIAQKRDFTMHLYLKEIHNLKILDKTFKLDDNIINRLEKAHNIYFDSRKEPFEVILLLQSNAIVYFERKPLNGQYLKKNSDGTAELTISATNKEEIFPILKSWLPQIKVIEPPELQEEFEEMLQKYLMTN